MTNLVRKQICKCITLSTVLFFLSVLGLTDAAAVLKFEASAISGFNGPYHIISADLNNDTMPDLAVTNWVGNVVILLGDGLGHYAVASTLATATHPNFIAAGDFDNNGSTDLAVNNGIPREVSLFFNDGSGASWTTSTLEVGTEADLVSVVAANFTAPADNHSDLFIVRDSGYIADFYEVWRGDGTGAFTKVASGDTGDLPVYAMASDFNGDTRLDIAIANYNSGSITILLGQGNGTFSEAAGSPISVGAQPRAIAAGHFNGDGQIDLAVTNSGENTVSILMGNGDGTFTPAESIDSSDKPGTLAIADFDGDGKNDIAVTLGNSNLVSIYRGNGNGTFDPSPADFPAGTTPFFIATADMDKDGKPDLAVTNYGSNEVTILLNRSGECIQAPSGLVSWWGGDNNALDMVSTNHGTVNGATYASGLVGQALSFDGVDDYVNVPYSSSLDLQSSLTISAWINSTNNSTQNRGIVGKSGGYQMFVEPGGLLDFGFYNGQWTHLHSSIPIPENVWVHVAGTFNSADGTMQLYINGVPDTNLVTAQRLSANANSVKIGGFGMDGAPFSGRIDEVGIFNRALSASEVHAIYNAGSEGMCRPCAMPPTGLVSWWTADGNATDRVGTNHGMLQGNATYAEGKVGQAFSLDGVDDYVQVASPTSLPLGNEARTIGVWLKTPRDLTSSTESSIVQYGTADYFRMFGLITSANAPGKLYFYGHGSDLASATTIQPETWYHAAVTYDGATIRLYVNGQPEASAPMVLDTVLDGNGLTIGHRPGGSHWEGFIDEAAVFNRALTAEEIAAIYATGTTGMCAISPDITPDVFTFIDQTGVALNTLTTSNSVTVSAVNVAAPISITGGEYELNGSGTWTTAVGTVNNGDTVRVRRTSSSNYSITTDATLTIGGVSDTFSVTTIMADTTPDPFAFISQTGMPLRTTIVSNPVSITGINDATPISVTGPGAAYSISIDNGITWGGWLSTPGAVLLNNQVKIRVTSSASGGTQTSATLMVGGGSSTFIITTQGAPLLPNDDFEVDPDGTMPPNITGWDVDFYGMNDCGARGDNPWGSYQLAISTARSYSGRGSVYSWVQNAGGQNHCGDPNTRRTTLDLVAAGPLATSAETLYLWLSDVSWTAPSRWNWNFAVELTDGTVTEEILLACRAWGNQEGCPGNVFSNHDQTDTGVDGQIWYRHPIPIPVGMNRINLTIRIRHRQDSWDGNTAESSLYYDLVTTAATGDPSVNGLVSWWRAEGNAYDSVGGNHGLSQGGTVFAEGIAGQAFSFDGVDDYVDVPHADSLDFGPNQPMSLSLWVKRTSTSAVNTLLAKRPDCGSSAHYILQWYGPGDWFHFGSTGGLDNGVHTTADKLPLDSWTFISVTFDGAVATMYINGEAVANHAMSFDPNTVPLTIGGEPTCGDFFGGLIDEVKIYDRALSAAEVATLSGMIPNAFTFTSVTGALVSSSVESDPITVTGISYPTAISITGGEYAISTDDGNTWDDWTSVVGAVSLNDQVLVRQTSSGSYSTTTTATLTIGGIIGSFSVTTISDTYPDAFTFVDQTGVSLSTLMTSNSITASGIDAPTPISIVGGEYEINGSNTWMSVAGTVNNGDTIRVRQTSSANFSTTTDATLTIGGVSDTFSVTTLASDITPDAFVFVDQTNVQPNALISSNSVTVAGINTVASISVLNGQYSINGGTYTSLSGTVNNGDTVRVRQTSSSNFSTTTGTIITIGGVSDTFSVTTLLDTDADGIPDVSDNCPNIANANQLDTDGDGIGDACEAPTVLTVSKTGTGGGTVLASSGSLVWTGDTGTETYDYNTSVTLTATAGAGSYFAGWTGCSHGSGNTCDVRMGANHTVEATFAQVAIGGFNDVASGFWADDFIYAMSQAGITGGCGNGNYCPDDPVTREMMAVFIVTAMGETGSQAAYNAYFTDIANNGFAPFINRMNELGITTGCGGGHYCPFTQVTREMMAVFILAAMGEVGSQAAYNAYFSDIGDNGFAPFINRMNELGITGGCGAGQYCPSAPVIRAGMAVFLGKAFLGM